MKTPNYSLLEGNFLSQAPILDRSVNILMFRDPDDNEYNIMINRATLEEDQETEAFCEAQIEELRNKLPGFQMEGKLLRNEIGPARLPVVQIANHYLQDGKKVRQVQSVIKLPWHGTTNHNEREVLIFTLYSLEEFSEYQRKHYVQIINTFQPNHAL
ncbi:MULTISPECIES: DcrB-related protein [Lelliottia]|uniref:DcrB-related protein n=1 Tax=Lelliottia wanjuensis TaxID=3050585 RepID=A0AAP4FTA5_9ENTR|nr:MULTISPECIES: DcrB-related protein [unclassified Lelliottia]MDK9357610.1 DcrB-related protein [Lelliottia sp. V106_16]MDK9361835.1 DcrB-related protein [Lelliottia sp. V106_12]MDK9372898.1 DcrB-related protein [Lelliottia sp. V106_10]MDK9582987.1 DcrB-related protein [Lelliottia sp. V86_10]MDK9599702.1 DcrB-related protein [Lelliottia sp. V106_5]